MVLPLRRLQRLRCASDSGAVSRVSLRPHPAARSRFVHEQYQDVGPTAVNEARVSFFRTSTRRDNPKAPLPIFRSSGLLPVIGTWELFRPDLPVFRKLFRPIYFNNFSIGVPTLTTFPTEQYVYGVRWFFEGPWAAIR